MRIEFYGCQATTFDEPKSNPRYIKKKTGTASRNGGQSFEFQRARLDEDWIGTATN